MHRYCVEIAVASDMCISVDFIECVCVFICLAGLLGTAHQGGVAVDGVGVAEGGVAWAEGTALTLAENVTSTDTAATTNREYDVIIAATTPSHIPSRGWTPATWAGGLRCDPGALQRRVKALFFVFP